jgi:hypothetical protein
MNAMNKAVDIPEYDIFTKTKDNDKTRMSYEDKLFLKQKNDQFTKDYMKLGISVAFSDTTSTAAKQQAQRRAAFLERSLKKNAVKREHFLAFMGKILDNNHAEVAPPLQENGERS